MGLSAEHKHRHRTRVKVPVGRTLASHCDDSAWADGRIGAWESGRVASPEVLDQNQVGLVKLTRNQHHLPVE
jgi:hypothetical protein